jgi:tetratricopeptide (TPR) repeat protein
MAFPSLEESFGVTREEFRQSAILVGFVAVAIFAIHAAAGAQSDEDPNSAQQAVVYGYVRESTGKAVADTTIFLEPSNKTQGGSEAAQTTHSDSQGAYRFVVPYAGSYTLRAEGNGYARASFGPVNLTQKERKTVDLTLEPSADAPGRNAPQSTSNGKPATQTQPAFFDEPQFTVAGVTQASNSGGHGSDTVLRTTEALAKATVSLSDDSSTKSQEAASAMSEAGLRGAVERDPKNFDALRKLCEFLVSEGKSAEALDCLQRATRLNPEDGEVHHLLGTAEENSDKPLEAVREYQRAAELDPSEENIFDWGSDLLKHRALEPANVVLARGNRLFPKSVRMQIALGVSWYARGFYDRATQCLANASDLAPNDATPYLFMGKMLGAEINPSDEAVEKLARFAQLQPDRALANYYYALALLKQSAAAGNDHERSALVEPLLQKAVQLDPKLGDGYLQLGTLYARRADYARAIAAYQKAVTANPDLEQTIAEAHYRLSQMYIRTGDKTKAQEELQAHDQLTKKLKEDTELDRRTILEFVVSLQKGSSAAPHQP